MKHKIENQQAANTRLVLLDFEVTFALTPEEAIADLHALVHDRASCLARITDLPGDETFHGGVSEAALAEYRDEIQQLANGDLWQALYENRLSDDTVGRLHRMTCEPTSLWTVHRAVLKAEQTPDEEPGTGLHGETKAEGLTTLAGRVRDHAEAWPEFADRLRPWLPALFTLAECAEPEAEVPGFLAFLLTQREHLGNRPLLEQLGSFAADYLESLGYGKVEVLRSLKSDKPTLEALVVLRILSVVPTNDPGWVDELRQWTLAQRVRTLKSLVSLPAPTGLGANPIELKNVRTEWFRDGVTWLGNARTDFNV